MKKILALLSVAALLIPVVALAAAGSGGTTDYKWSQIAVSGNGITPWTVAKTRLDADSVANFTIPGGLGISQAVPETTFAFAPINPRANDYIGEVINPWGGAVWTVIHFFSDNTADTVAVTLQALVGNDWVTIAGGTTNGKLVSGGTLIVQDAATAVTTPYYEDHRLIYQDYDGSSTEGFPNTEIWIALTLKD